MLAIVFAGCNEEPDKSELTFADIEDDFGFPYPLTEMSKSNILKKWGTVEEYRSVLVKIYETKEVITLSNKKGVAALYKVDLEDLLNDVYYIDCFDDQTIIDAGEDYGIDIDVLPYSCKVGACSSCTARLVSGEIDQSDQAFLDNDQLEDGFFLSCVAYPRSDIYILTCQEHHIN